VSIDVTGEHDQNGGDDRKAGVRRTALLLAGVALMVYAAFIVASVLRS